MLSKNIKAVAGMHILLIFGAMLLPAAASDMEITTEQKLNGIMHFGNAPCAARPGKPCIAYFELYGTSAKNMYDNMKAAPKTDICTEGTMKTEPSGLHCYHSGAGDYGCYFGYDFSKRQIVEGAFSC